jgi:hypothetical protein
MVPTPIAPFPTTFSLTATAGACLPPWGGVVRGARVPVSVRAQAVPPCAALAGSTAASEVGCRASAGGSRRT